MLPNSRPRNRCKIAGGGGLTARFRACYLYNVFPLAAGNSSQPSLSSRCIFLYLDRQYPALQNGPNRLPNPYVPECAPGGPPGRQSSRRLKRLSEKKLRKPRSNVAKGRTKGGKDPERRGHYCSSP